MAVSVDVEKQLKSAEAVVPRDRSFPQNPSYGVCSQRKRQGLHAGISIVRR